MHDSKETALTSERSAEGEQDSPADDHEIGVQARSKSDSDGWQQYRKWISKAPAPRSRSTGVDPSLYTWKGYRSWSEQVKRNWSDS